MNGKQRKSSREQDLLRWNKRCLVSNQRQIKLSACQERLTLWQGKQQWRSASMKRMSSKQASRWIQAAMGPVEWLIVWPWNMRLSMSLSSFAQRIRSTESSKPASSWLAWARASFTLTTLHSDTMLMATGAQKELILQRTRPPRALASKDWHPAKHLKPVRTK